MIFSYKKICIVRKVVDTSKRSVKQTHWGSKRSQNMPVRRLDQRALKYIISKKGKKRASIVAEEMNVSTRWIQKIWQYHTRTGKIPQPKKMGRPKKTPTPKIIHTVLTKHAARPVGVVRLQKQMHNSKISRHIIYKIMKEEGLVVRSKAKSKRRKWVRYERKYSNAMWHADWHTMKDPRLKGLDLIVYLDDASRCVTGFGLFSEATTDHSIMVLRDAMKKFGVPGQILTDHGTQFTSNHTGVKKPKHTAYEQELLDNGIAHVMARVKHPQTNGKIERFFQTLETEIGWFEGLPEFIQYYNEERLHFSLDIDNCETPRMAFRSKKATLAIKKNNPKWMEEDAHE